MSIEEIVIEIQKGNTEVKNELWERIWKLIFVLCKPYRDYAEQKHFDMDDLMNTAWIGVEYAIADYNPEKGHGFLAYLRYHIQNSIRELLGLRGKKQPDTISLDETIDEDGELTRLDTIEDNSAAEEFNRSEDKQFAEWLWSRVERLPERERNTVLSYYRDNIPMTEYARRSGCSANRANYIKDCGLRLLARDKEIRQLYEDFAYQHVSVTRFKSTWTSATEWAVLQILQNENKEILHR